MKSTDVAKESSVDVSVSLVHTTSTRNVQGIVLNSGMRERLLAPTKVYIISLKRSISSGYDKRKFALPEERRDNEKGRSEEGGA